jgi:hypothetical protein
MEKIKKETIETITDEFFIFEIMRRMDKGDGVTKQDVFAVCDKLCFNLSSVDSIIENFKADGIIYEPRTDFIKITK